MIWKHIKKLHWACTDIDGVTMNVQKDSEGMWMFTVVGNNMSVKTTHGHPLEAMQQSESILSQKEAVREQEKQLKEKGISEGKTQDCQVESSL